MNLTPEFIPHEDFHRGSWLKAKGSNWYYFLRGEDNEGEISNKWFDNTLDPEIKSLVKLFHDNDIKTSPSCAGHFSKANYFEDIWDQLDREKEKINSDGLKLYDSENNDETIFKDKKYDLPWGKKEFVNKAMEYQKKGVLGIFKDDAKESVISKIKKIDIPNLEIQDKSDVLLFIVDSEDDESMKNTWADLENQIESILNNLSEIRKHIRSVLSEIHKKGLRQI